MGLRELVEQDLDILLEDDVCGAGWPIKVVAPDGIAGHLIGQSDDIAQLIDPDTGQAVSGRFAGVVLRLKTLRREGLGIPKAICDNASKPWLVCFEDIGGVEWQFKVIESNPDLTTGVVALSLGLYQ